MRLPAAAKPPDAAASKRREAGVAAILFVALLAAYNANGREIGSYDTRPTQLAGRELLLRRTLSLNHVVGATPQYADRWGFILARDGRYRSIYSPISAIEAAALTWPFWRTGAIDITAPLAPQLMAKATASVLVALAVTIAYVTVRRWLPRGRALLLAAGLGLGTGLWSSASQTLWQTETSLLGLSVAMFAFTMPREARRAAASFLCAAGLALAGVARPQLAPAIAVVIAGVWWRWGTKSALIVCAVLTAAILPLVAANWRWFGHPLGALPQLEAVNATLHGTGRTFGVRLEGWAGLLVSPSRGLIVFSPIVLIAAAGIRRAIAQGAAAPFVWCAAAFAAQFVLYASYSVWWGGHTYGPRYLLDVLPLIVPLAAQAMTMTRPHAVVRSACAAALGWSIVVAATGAFCYPHDAWNTEPTEIDTHHERLWSIADNQIRRCWQQGLSPQNFSLFDRAALRHPSS